GSPRRMAGVVSLTGTDALQVDMSGLHRLGERQPLAALVSGEDGVEERPAAIHLASQALVFRGKVYDQIAQPLPHASRDSLRLAPVVGSFRTAHRCAPERGSPTGRTRGADVGRSS